MKLNKFWKICCILLIGIIGYLPLLRAQENFYSKTINFKKTEISLSEILNEFANQGISFSYNGNTNNEEKLFHLKKKELTLKEVLDLIVKESCLAYKVYDGYLIIKNKIKKSYRVSGFVHCGYSGEQLIGANVYNSKTLEGITSNNYGFYSYSYDEESIKLHYSYVGYKAQEIELKVAHDTLINIKLEPDNLLKEVTIKDENNSLINSSLCSKHRLSLKNIESQPLVLGEKDVLKTIQLLPGIQPALEGSTGLQVRGGSHSQNLILIDNVTIYNIDHAFGYFSIFNSDAIKSVQVYKGAFPARLGGGVSSIIDIRMNEGNNEHFQFDFSTGLLISKIKIELPLVKQKTGLMISARRADLDFPLKIINSGNGTGLYENYSFGDIYAKINHKFSDRNRVYLSCFYGYDKYLKEEKLINDTTNLRNESVSNLRWNNFALAARWYSLIKDNLFCNSTITFSGFRYSHYNYELIEHQGNTSSVNKDIYDTNHYSGIKDLEFKVDFDLPANDKHYFRFGISSSMNIYQPFMEGSLIMVSKETDNMFGLPKFNISYDTLMNFVNINSYTISAYFENDINLSPKIKTNLGLRLSSYFCNNKDYSAPEPRLSFRFLILSNLSIKTGYSRMSQNKHLLSSSFLVMPFNVWVASTNEVKPLFSDQITLSCNYNLKHMFDISLEGFYKTIQNDILYKTGYKSKLSWENFIEQGLRRSYGLEMLVSKQEGEFTGWLGYTLSKTERKFASVNNGNYFPYWLVRKHKISATFNYKICKYIDFGASWVYSSGVSGNSGYQELAPILFYQNRKSDEHRDSWTLIKNIPAYHKLDIGINFHIQERRFKHLISIGVNNAYARSNPLLISEYEGYLYLSMINVFMPFIQYSIKIK